jgi:hypothetical protein
MAKSSRAKDEDKNAGLDYKLEVTSFVLLVKISVTELFF